MRRSLSGRRVLITGASSGIGDALLRELVQAQAQVAAIARRGDRLTAAHLPITADITSPADRERAIRETVAAFGGLDILINNAGIGSWCHFANSTEAINRQILEVNFFAPVELAWPEYSASKFALVGMSEAWRGEFARFGVDVITIVPGLTKTGLSQNLLRKEGKADIPFDQGMEPVAVAQATLQAIRNNRTEVILGSDAKRMLRINRFFPRLLDRLIARKVIRLYRDERSGKM